MSGLPDFKPGDHLCWLYETDEEHRALVVRFVRQGIERGEKVLYITDAHTVEAILDDLRKGGLSVDRYLERGQLSVLTSQDTYLRAGTFDPDRMIAVVREATAHALTEGYPALRVTGEMTWALRGLSGSDRLIDYESKLNAFFPGSKCVGLCQYDRRRFDPAALINILATHPTVIVGTERYNNVHYIPPDSFRAFDLPAATLEHWLGTLEASKRAEDALVESQRFMQSTLDALSAQVAVLDDSGTIIAVNAAWRRFAESNQLGVPRYGIGMNYFEVCRMASGDGADAATAVMAGMRELLAGERQEFSLEYPCRGTNGERWVALRMTRFQGSGSAYVVAAREDITDRKRAEAILRESEDRYRDLVEHSQDLICIHDLDGRILNVNWGAANRLGYEPEALLTKTIRDILAPDTRHEFDAYLERIRTEGKAEGLMKVRTRTGEPLVWEYRNTLRTEGVGRPVVRGLAHDVTERIETERALRESEERLALAMRATSDVIRDWNITTGEMGWNEALKVVFGHAVKDADSHIAGGYQWWVDHIHPEDRERAIAELQSVLSGGVEFTSFEYRFRRADGSYATVTDRGYVSRSRQGRPVRMVGSMMDITQARLAETELRQRKRELADFFENAPVAIHWVGPDGRIIRANQAELGLLGYSRDEYVGHHIAEFHADEGVAEDLLRRLSRNETVRAYEARLRHRDGSVRHALIDSNVMWEDGRFVHTRCFTRDITEQKLAEQALRRADAELRQVMNSVSDCLWSARVDRAGLLSYSYFSPNVERILGWPAEFFLPGQERWLEIIHPEDRPRAAAALSRVTTGQPGREEEEYRVMLPDGSIRWIRDSVVVTRLEDGSRRLDGVISDIHERKQTEEARRALYLSSLEIQTPMGLQERLSRLLETARTVLQLDRVNILLADLEERWLQAAASLGAEEPLKAIRVPIGPEGGGIAQAYLTRQMIVWGGDVPVPEELRLKPPYDRIEAFRSRVFANVPLIVQGRAIGVLGADRKHTRRPLDPATLELLQLFASNAAVAIHSAQLFERIVAKRGQLQHVSRRLVEVQERERRHLARELHDEVGQLLTGLQLMLEAAGRSRLWTVKPKLLQAQTLIGDLMRRVREMSLELRPPMLDDLGLLSALLWYFDRYTAQTGTEVILKQGHIEGRRFPHEVETAAYRIVQEALTNVARHARVRVATVRLWADDGVVNVQVQDDGVGFDGQAAMTGDASCGLLGMRERALSLGGYLTIDSAPGAGTRVAAELPLKGRSERRRVQRGDQR